MAAPFRLTDDAPGLMIDAAGVSLCCGGPLASRRTEEGEEVRSDGTRRPRILMAL